MVEPSKIAITDQPLIVGAGPVGLAAALFCARAGIRARLIDRAPAPCPWSRALAVNPRSLEILEATGVAGRMISIGKPILFITFWRERRPLARLPLGRGRRFPMLAISQATSERLLLEELFRHGIEVERSTELIDCKAIDGRAEVSLRTPGGVDRGVVRVPWALAADGAQSEVRRRLGVEFQGSAFPEVWRLSDVPLDSDLDLNSAHVVFFDDGGFAMFVRVIDDRIASEDPVWRVLSTRADGLERSGRGRATGPAIWESQFTVAHKIAERMGDGPFFLAGDAAHVHSPAGARGMNLGIEDAYVFARLAQANALGRYSAMRRPVNAAAVKRVEFMTYLARGASPLARLARVRGLPRLAKLEPFVARLLASVAGVDHPLPAINAMV